MRKSGINSNTPNDFLLGAGVVFKNFKYVYSKVDATGSTQPEGTLRVIADNSATEKDTEIRISKLTPNVSFIGLDKSYTKPAVGDYVTGAWTDDEDHVLGATNGGNKLSIVPEITAIEVDGATVEIKGLNQKTGETGTLDVNLAQHTKESIKRAIVGKEADTLIKGYAQIETKSLIELSDYLDNIAFVGTMTDGTEIIAILENAICTSGLELDNKNKETSVCATTFKSTADFKGNVFDKLPIYIFYPNKATA